MKVRYYIDPATGQPHIYSHNVAETEVEEVLGSPDEDRSGRDGARVAIGRTLKCICHYSLRSPRQGSICLSAPQAQNRAMKQNKFPPGWDEQRVKRVLSHYESQSEDEAVAEDEAAQDDSSGTMMAVPNELVPEVRELIAKHKKNA